MSAQSHPVAGFFGKLPAHGDFVRRQLPTEWVERWDRWLQGGLVATHATLGNEWLECYLSAPIWRFLVSEHIMGSAWLGVIMPSVDRVGRYFPFTVATELPPKANPWQWAVHSQNWLDEVEVTLLQALEDDLLDADTLQQRLLSLPWDWLDRADNDSDARAITSGAGEIHIPLADTELVAGLPTLVNHLLPTTLGAYSLWWTEGSSRLASCLRIFSGLPPVERFWTLLDCGDADAWSKPTVSEATLVPS